MFAGISAFVATTTGKVVLGTAMAAASVGGAHAADIVDLPLLPESTPAAVIVVEDDAGVVGSVAAVEGEPDEGETTGEEAVGDPGSAEELAQDENAAEGDESEAVGEAVEGDESGDVEEPRNHGAVVSEFAHTTELEGCERGQAIAAVASSNAAEHRQNPEGEKDKCGSAEELAQDENAAEGDESEAVGEAVEGDESGDVEEPRNHGAVVSEFAHTTELEGCERGQAIAAVASSNAAEHRQNPEDEKDKCGSDEELAQEEDAVEEEDAGEQAGAEEADDDDEDRGNRPDHAGPPEGAGRPDDPGRSNSRGDK